MSSQPVRAAPVATPFTPTPTLASLIDHQRALHAAAGPREAFGHFADVMAGHGFDQVFAGRLSLAQLTDLSPDPFAFSRSDEGFIEAYLRDGLFTDDPVFARARLDNRPFRWRTVHADATPAQRRVIEAFARAGLTHGLCVPIDRVRGVAGIVTLGRSEDFDLGPEQRIEIEMLSRTLFGLCDAHFRTAEQRPITLTQRESGVLSLVAQGKTNWEAGQILGVSEYSVRDYLRILSTKLQTTNRTHTVVRAMQLGLIAV